MQFHTMSRLSVTTVADQVVLLAADGEIMKSTALMRGTLKEEVSAVRKELLALIPGYHLPSPPLQLFKGRLRSDSVLSSWLPSLDVPQSDAYK